MEAEAEERFQREAAEEDRARRAARLRAMVARLGDVKKGWEQFPYPSRRQQLGGAIEGAEAVVPADPEPTLQQLATLGSAVETAERLLRTMQQVCLCV